MHPLTKLYNPLIGLLALEGQLAAYISVRRNCVPAMLWGNNTQIQYNLGSVLRGTSFMSGYLRHNGRGTVLSGCFSVKEVRMTAKIVLFEISYTWGKQSLAFQLSIMPKGGLSS